MPTSHSIEYTCKSTNIYLQVMLQLNLKLIQKRDDNLSKQVIRQADSFNEAMKGFEADVAEYFENAEG